ncbi:MAG: hypothetical protein U0174_17080 [Polyangiaceae bacterium]
MIKLFSSKFLSGAVLLSFLAFAVDARADAPSAARTPTPSASDMESARELVADARALRAKGNLAAALEKYKAAHALVHTAITGVELARTYADLKMPVEARDVCLEVQRMPVSPAETERSTVARTEAATLGEEMRSKVASLSIRIALAPPNADVRVTVTLDGRVVPTEALGQPRRINPGSHDVTAQVEGGEKTSRKVEAAEGSSQELVLHLAPPTMASTPSKPGQPEKTAVTHMSPFVPVGLTIGGVGLVVGVVGGVSALATQGELRTACQDKRCPDSVDFEATASRAKTWATVSTIGFGVAIVGAAMTVVGLLNPVTERSLPAVSRTRAPTGATLRLTPTIGGLHVDGQF